MIEPDIAVSIEDMEFSIDELQQFIDTVKSIDGMPANALVVLSNCGAMFTLTSSTGFRAKGD